MPEYSMVIVIWLTNNASSIHR